MKKLNKQTCKSISYVQNALSFLFLHDENIDFINSIYLYGSAARGELTEKSDIDIFIDCNVGKEKKIEQIAKAAFSNFYQSTDYQKWKYFRFLYPLSVQAGELLTWQLKTSVMADGILLYSKKAEIVPAERQVLFTFVLPKDKKKYLRFIRSLYGRKEKGYKEHGFLLEFQGKKISSDVIMIPKENQQKMLQFLQKCKINYSMKEICVFG